MSHLRPLPLLLLLAACGGASAPPPPVASATASPATTASAGDDLKPLSSRDGAAATAGPADAQALPPGHPPLEGAGAAGPAAAPMPPGHPPVGEPAAGAKSSTGTITGTIALSPKLKVGPSDVMYIMAKQGAATLAVRRVEKPAFPYAFEISGSDAMMGGGAFEGPVDIVARVSRTGDAIPAKGDLEGSAKNLKVPSKGVTFTIASVRE